MTFEKTTPIDAQRSIPMPIIETKVTVAKTIPSKFPKIPPTDANADSKRLRVS